MILVVFHFLTFDNLWKLQPLQYFNIFMDALKRTITFEVSGGFPSKMFFCGFEMAHTKLLFISKHPLLNSRIHVLRLYFREEYQNPYILQRAVITYVMTTFRLVCVCMHANIERCNIFTFPFLYMQYTCARNSREYTTQPPLTYSSLSIHNDELSQQLQMPIILPSYHAWHAPSGEETLLRTLSEINQFFTHKKELVINFTAVSLYYYHK